jgi:type I restriction enzyme S subunit
MKQGWQIKKLGELCDFINGLWKGKKEPFQNVGVIRNTNFSKDYTLDYSKVVYLDVEVNQFGKRKLKYGDIILEKSGGGPKQPVGRVVIFDKKIGDYSFSNFTSAIRIKDESEIDFNYLHKYLVLKYISGETEKIQSYSTGIRNLKFDDYKEIPIPIPPLSEQKRIVAVLDEAFEVIEKAKENTEQNLKNVKEIFESYLQGVFENKGDDWEEKKLGEVCETGAGGTPLKTHKDYYEGGTIPWLLSGEVSQGEVFEARNFITEKGFKNSSAKLFPPNTVLVAMYGATAGQVGILRFEACTNQAVCGILPNKNFMAEFLYYKFLAAKELLVSQAVGGAQPNISQIKIKNTLIPILTIKQQQTIVHQLDALRAETQKLEAIYTQKLADLEELKKSLLQKAFVGELVK